MIDGRVYRAVPDSVAGFWEIWTDEGERYYTTRDTCSCGDAVFRKRLCKHSKALRELDRPAPLLNQVEIRDDSSGQGCPP